MRAVLVAILLLICAPALAASIARPTTGKMPAAPMAFYVVNGAADACGRGCDSWIAAEGQIDAGAAPRFRKFLHQLGDRRLPIYFYSPGGNLEQALAMGAMLRETVSRYLAAHPADLGPGAVDRKFTTVHKTAHPDELLSERATLRRRKQKA